MLYAVYLNDLVFVEFALEGFGCDKESRWRDPPASRLTSDPLIGLVFQNLDTHTLTNFTEYTRFLIYVVKDVQLVKEISVRNIFASFEMDKWDLVVWHFSCSGMNVMMIWSEERESLRIFAIMNLNAHFNQLFEGVLAETVCNV